MGQLWDSTSPQRRDKRRNRPPAKSHKRCPVTKKRTFGGRDAALLAITKMKRGDRANAVGYTCRECGELHFHKPTWQPYPCRHCGGWHLTSNKPQCTRPQAA